MIYFQVVATTIEVALVLAIGGVLIHTAMWPLPSVPSKTRQRVGDGLIYAAVFVFIGSGVSKFAHVPLAVTEMGLLGLTGPKYVLVASIEITSGVLLVIRRVRSFALLFNSAHVGGAICAHLIAAQYFAVVPSAIVLSVCWLGAFLRHPQVLWSFSEVASSGRKLPRRELARPSQQVAASVFSEH